MNYDTVVEIVKNLKLIYRVHNGKSEIAELEQNGITVRTSVQRYVNVKLFVIPTIVANKNTFYEFKTQDYKVMAHYIVHSKHPIITIVYTESDGSEWLDLMDDFIERVSGAELLNKYKQLMSYWAI